MEIKPNTETEKFIMTALNIGYRHGLNKAANYSKAVSDNIYTELKILRPYDKNFENLRGHFEAGVLAFTSLEMFKSLTPFENGKKAREILSGKISDQADQEEADEMGAA